MFSTSLSLGCRFRRVGISSHGNPSLACGLLSFLNHRPFLFHSSLSRSRRDFGVRGSPFVGESTQALFRSRWILSGLCFLAPLLGPSYFECRGTESLRLKGFLPFFLLFLCFFFLRRRGGHRWKNLRCAHPDSSLRGEGLYLLPTVTEMVAGLALGAVPALRVF